MPRLQDRTAAGYGRRSGASDYEHRNGRSSGQREGARGNEEERRVADRNLGENRQVETPSYDECK